MQADINEYINKLSGQLNDKAYEASDSLGHFGGEEIIKAMIALLNHPNLESRYLAARTLALIENNDEALVPMLEAIKNDENAAIRGDLLMELEGFDVSTIYVELFKLYLFGSFKVSHTAKELLDFNEFDITPRVLKKAQKHWNHYSNNTKHDDAFELRKSEVEAMLSDLKEFIEIT